MIKLWMWDDWILVLLLLWYIKYKRAKVWLKWMMTTERVTDGIKRWWIKTRRNQENSFLEASKSQMKWFGGERTLVLVLTKCIIIIVLSRVRCRHGRNNGIYLFFPSYHDEEIIFSFNLFVCRGWWWGWVDVTSLPLLYLSCCCSFSRQSVTEITFLTPEHTSCSTSLVWVLLHERDRELALELYYTIKESKEAARTHEESF